MTTTLSPARAAAATELKMAAAVFALFALVILIAMATGQKELARDMAMTLRDAFLAVVFYHWGSSRGSQAKDAAVAKALGGTMPDSAA